MDGEIDYSNYSLEQLREAEAGIDRAAFPRNLARLQAELNRRGASARQVPINVGTSVVSDNKPITVRTAVRVRLVGWIERTSYLRLVVGYIFAVPTCLALGWLAFYFPVFPIYSLLGWEFPNLGPIVTFLWGFLIMKFVLTPAFVIVLLFKSFLQRSDKA